MWGALLAIARPGNFLLAEFGEVGCTLSISIAIGSRCSRQAIGGVALYTVPDKVCEGPQGSSLSLRGPEVELWA